jgi:hypothetical protein
MLEVLKIVKTIEAKGNSLSKSDFIFPSFKIGNRIKYINKMKGYINKITPITITIGLNLIKSKNNIKRIIIKMLEIKADNNTFKIFFIKLFGVSLISE